MAGSAGYSQVPQPEREIIFAGFVMRLISYIIDGIFVTLMALIVGMIAGIAMNLDNLTILNVSYTASGLITLPYIIGFWAMMGGTPGKIMLGMRIVGPDGSINGIGWGRAILRFLGYIASTIPRYLGFMWIAIDKDNRGWHDKISGTYVVNV